MTTTRIPTTRGEMLKLIVELRQKLDEEGHRIQARKLEEPLPEGSEPESSTYYAALVAPAPSDQWEC